MSLQPWRFTYASVIGASHTKVGSVCQDASLCEVLTTASGDVVLVAVVSDGAGSAEYSADGANLACVLAVDEVRSLFETGGAILNVTEDFCQRWLVRFRKEVSIRAAEVEKSERDFACTVLMAVIGTDEAAFMQVGDGAIVVQSSKTPGDYDWIFWPEKGEYENQTYFATDPFADHHLQYDFAKHPIDEVALFSDGLQRLALHMESQAAYAPFFRPMFTPLYSASEGYSPDLATSLTQFLLSPRIQEKTDDDTSLILATRISNDEIV